MSRRILPPTDAYPHSPPPPLKYTPWSSEFPAENLSKLALTRIKFYYDTQPNYNGKVRLSRIMCIYNETTAHGTDLTRHTSTTKHKEHIVVLDRDEWIIKVDGWQYSSVLMNITLFTNKQRVHRPCGESTLLMVDGEPARPFSIESGDKGLGLLWLSGLAFATGIRCLKVSWADYPALDPFNAYPAPFNPHPAPFIAHNGSILNISKNESEARFSKIISSPPLTLLVGRPPKSFFVHPGIIETLPFSSSTLDLEQMDGTHKTINLPKEDPEVFAALIEYLTTGKYTYHENADNDITPNLAQVLFHLNLYATAIRYDCKDLARNVLKIVNDVLVGLGAIDSLTAWKAAYLHACGLSMANFEASEAGHAMLTKLNKLGNHYTHRLVKLTEECPALAGDLLVFLAQNVETEAGGNEEEMEE